MIHWQGLWVRINTKYIFKKERIILSSTGSKVWQICQMLEKINGTRVPTLLKKFQIHSKTFTVLETKTNRNKTNLMIMPICNFRTKDIKIHIMDIMEDKFRWMIRKYMEVHSLLIRMLSHTKWMFKCSKTTAITNQKYHLSFKTSGITKTNNIKIIKLKIQALSDLQLHHMTTIIKIPTVTTSEVFRMTILNSNMIWAIRT